MMMCRMTVREGGRQTTTRKMRLKMWRTRSGSGGGEGAGAEGRARASNPGDLLRGRTSICGAALGTGGERQAGRRTGGRGDSGGFQALRHYTPLAAI